MAYTQEELNNIVNSLIIDNNINQITPAKVREVFLAVISSVNQTSASAVSATPPLNYDAFTNVFSMLKANATTNGYLSKEDWALFMAGTGGGGGSVDSVNGQTGVVSLDTDDIPEGSAKYSTLSLVMSYVLTGISFATGGTVIATDTILIAFGKIQKQINDILTSIGLKQDTLVSGTNIKTINSISILGSGNLNTPDMDTTTAQTVSGVKTFLNGMFALRNVANTFSILFTNAVTAARTITWPDKSGTVAMTSDIVSYTNPYTFFLDAVSGNDTTAIVGDISRPYATINAVLTAITADTTKDYQINIKKGTYTQTVASPIANIVYYSESLVILNINIAPIIGGTNTHIYQMPISNININYSGGTNIGYKVKIICANLSIIGNPHYRINLLSVRCDSLTLTTGFLFDTETSAGAKLDMVCINITSTGTSGIYSSAGGISVYSLEFDNATSTSGSLTIHTGAGTGYISFKKYTATTFTQNAFGTAVVNSSVFYDFYNSTITNGGFNPGQNGYDTCVISGKVTIVNTSGGCMFWSFSQFTFLNAYVICDTHLIYRSQGVGCFKMANSYLEIAGNYSNNESLAGTFVLPVVYAIGACEIFQSTTPNTFFNFHVSSTGMFMRLRGTLKMNNTGLPAGMTTTNDTTNTY